ncbi:hypothetical protein J1N35_038421 [Gossypium stocksii]|uniref:DUF4283 domain-containing protein n=1 Tax=Gossypium stocksii TaxID=47602 RepID=A0A9D3ULT8_9ROSI|nr:hypothetical protein J1N35_038421 [Gossypium stocksii]
METLEAIHALPTDGPQEWVFLVKLQNSDGYEKVLSQGLWTIFGQYLMVQPWSIDFNPIKPYPSIVMTWIRFLRLLGHMYRKKILWEIGEMVGKLVKLDLNTGNKVRGRYARMAIYVNLEWLLIFKVLINGNIQQIEYESLLIVCFSYGQYGHLKDSCRKVEESLATLVEGNNLLEKELLDSATMVETDLFEPWILVERRVRKQIREPRNSSKNFQGATLLEKGDVNQKLHNSTVRRDTVSKDGFPSSANDKKIMGPIPWIAIGDFNAILSPNKKLGGNSSGRRCS